MKTHTIHQQKILFPIIAICFPISGAASLILEVTWSKYFSLLLGGTIFGVATVVAAFMAGLGLGSYAGGRASIRLQNHVRAYAWLEGIVGAFALLSPFIFTHLDGLFGIFFALSQRSFSLFLFVRFIFLFSLLMIPTVAMGASLPLLVEYFARRDQQHRGQIGFLYALNTIGAVFGTALAGFYLIPRIGLARTTLVAAILDLAIFAFLSLKPFPSVAPAEYLRVHAPPREKWSHKMRAAVLENIRTYWKGLLIALLFGFSGLLAMVYQVGWTRILIVPLGSSVYCFAIILFLFLSGLSIGAGVVARLAERTRSPLIWFAILEGIIAISTYLGSFLFGRLSSLTIWAFRASGGNPFYFFINEIIIAAPIVLPPTLAMGALFPFAARAYRDVIGKSGNAVGTIYAANTFGTILGSLGAGFLLIPLVGGRQSILIASVASAGVAIAALIIASGAPLLKFATAGVCIVAASGALYLPPVVSLIDVNSSLVGLLRRERGTASGYDSLSSPAEIARPVPSSPIPAMEKLVFYREGLNATVSIGADDRDRFLFINGKGDASTAPRDMLTQTMSGHLPMIFTPGASDVLIIGLGSGVTTHAVLTHPNVARVDTVEIESAVVEASAFFHDVNHNFLDDPRHSIIVEDARVYLAHSDRTYDAIISEPSNPWIAGINNCFTKEYYKLVNEKLRPGGTFCQWFQTYEISKDSIFVVLRTIRDVFSDAHIFYLSNFGDMLIIARKPPLRQPLPNRMFSIAAVAKDLAGVGIDDPALLSQLYKTSINNLIAGSEEGIRNTDDNCYLEHVAPLELVSSMTQPFTLLVRKSYFDDYHRLFYPDLPAGQVLVAAGAAAARKGDLNHAFWTFEICQDRGLSESAALLQAEIEKAVQKRKIQEEISRLMDQAEQLKSQGRMKEAIETLKQAGALDPQDNNVLSTAALYLMEFNQPKLAEMMFSELVRRNDPDYIYMAHVNLGILMQQRGAYEESLAEFKKALAVNPYIAPAYYFGSVVLRSQGKIDEAIELVRSGLRYGYDDPPLLLQLSSLLEQKGSRAEARRLRKLATRLEK